jgi:hypothetical protein
MIAGVKDSLDYFTKNFRPYQHRQVRILEFPRYATFAQCFPNTIPYSESIGFIAKVKRRTRRTRLPYYVTAHEVAHQWWAHQVIGAYVQGATMMSETLAQYSALMVMKKKYGDAKMKRFLKYELDAYLSGRGTRGKKEQPSSATRTSPTSTTARAASRECMRGRMYFGEERVELRPSAPTAPPPAYKARPVDTTTLDYPSTTSPAPRAYPAWSTWWRISSSAIVVFANRAAPHRGGRNAPPAHRPHRVTIKVTAKKMLGLSSRCAEKGNRGRRPHRDRRSSDETARSRSTSGKERLNGVRERVHVRGSSGIPARAGIRSAQQADRPPAPPTNVVVREGSAAR